MKRFLLIINPNKDGGLPLLEKLKEYIESRGGSTDVWIRTRADWYRDDIIKHLPKDCGYACVIAIGGDGTLVRAARDLAPLDVPVVGINMGTLGYLCELEPENMLTAVDRIFEDDFYLDRRMMIKACGGCISDIKKPADALNDIVLHWSGKSQMLCIDVSVDGNRLYTYSADGIIVSTPTGSTAYSLSAGGPIVDPRSELMLITPINPHGVMDRSIVIGAGSEVSLTLRARKGRSDTQADLILDGDTLFVMHDGDSVNIKKSDEYANVLRMDSQSFLQILGRKLSLRQ